MATDEDIHLISGDQISENHPLPIAGRIMRCDVEMTRPANTTAYTNGDVVSGNATTTVLMVFPIARQPGGSGTIRSAILNTDQKACVGVLTLQLFNVSTASVSADNAAGTILYANAAKFIGAFDFPALAEGVDTSDSTGAIAVASAVNLGFVCAANDENLYGVLVVKSAAFTPASGQKFTVTLFADVN